MQLAASIHHLFPDDVINDPIKGCYAKLLPTRKSCLNIACAHEITSQIKIFNFSVLVGVFLPVAIRNINPGPTWPHGIFSLGL